MRARVAAAAFLACCAWPLVILAADPELERLLERAQFWRDRARDDLAREELAKVFRLAPDNSEALELLARIQLAANQDRDAEATLQKLRAARPGDPAVARVAALLRVHGPDREKLRDARNFARVGRFDEAVQAYRALFPQGFPDDELALEYAQSLAATRAGREAGGAMIAQLAKKHPGDPRFQVALASDQSTRKPVSAATFATLKELTAVPPVSRQAREAWRRALLALDPVDESLAPLREYVAESPGDTAIAEKLEQVKEGIAAARRIRDDPGFKAKREAIQAMEAGNLAEAEPLFARAIEAHPHDAEAVGNMGVLRLKQGRHDEAREWFRRALALDPKAHWWGDLERTARYWGLLKEASAAREIGAYAAARSRVAEAMAIDAAEPAAKAELARIEAAEKTARAGNLRDTARELREKGREDESLAMLEQAHLLDPDNPWVVHDLARIYAAKGDAKRGDALFEEMKRRRPADLDVRYANALYLASVERDAEALALVEAIPAAQRSEGMTKLARRIELTREARRAEELIKAGDMAGADAIIAALRVAARDDPELSQGLTRLDSNSLEAASRIAQREGDVDSAVALEQRALALVPSDEYWRLRRLAELREQQLAWFGGALDALRRSGTPGKSQLDAEELPFGYRDRWSPSGRAFFRVAPSRISSGTLDLTNAFEVSTYGSLLLCQPGCPATPPSSVEKGVAITAGTQLRDVRLDLGSTPIGFPVVNVVGGLLYEGSAAGFSYSVDASRRPIVSSLLSYAGAHDPNTGQVWGGVVQNGVRVNASRDSGGTYGAWSLAGLYRITGKNVADNTKAEFMVGGYRRFINEENRQLAAGLTAMFWRFSDEAGQFTFGHGGYYSPKEYQSLSIPVTYAMRSNDTSFYVRASVSVSRSESWRAAYFPTDGALQAQAEALTPVNGVDPFYAGGNNGRSYGRSFAAAAEHRLAPNVYIGARLDIERSTNYTPSRLLLYVRMTPGVSSRPPSMPPEPVVLPGFQY